MEWKKLATWRCGAEFQVGGTESAKALRPASELERVGGQYGKSGQRGLRGLNRAGLGQGQNKELGFASDCNGKPSGGFYPGKERLAGLVQCGKSRAGGGEGHSGSQDQTHYSSRC